MSPQPTAHRPEHALVPELGPALGRLTALPGAKVGAPPRPRMELADLRLALVGRVFELAGSARDAGDPEKVSAILAPDRLRTEWERGASQVANRTILRIQESLAAAAERSGLSPRRLRRLAPTADERALITARLQGAGVPFVDGLTALDVAEDGTDDWTEALLASARLLESCWLDLEQRALAEEAAWSGEAARIAAWRPARWPRWVAATLLAAVCIYAGLVLGGYVPVPPGGNTVTSWWWTHE
jgi:hypothetical protein